MVLAGNRAKQVLWTNVYQDALVRRTMCIFIQISVTSSAWVVHLLHCIAEL